MDRRTPVSSSTSTLVPSPSPSRAREILPQRMAVEAVIGQHAAQIGMAAEEHAVHIPAFPLVPAGGRKDTVDGRNRLLLVRRQLDADRSEEHTSELQSLMRISYAVFCLKKKKSQHIAKLHSHR